MQEQQRLTPARPRHMEVSAIGLNRLVLDHWRALSSHSSRPALCRASTSLFQISKEDVDGRVKPGHDEMTLKFSDPRIYHSAPCLGSIPRL
jgi:hypothetical protein